MYRPAPQDRRTKGWGLRQGEFPHRNVFRRETRAQDTWGAAILLLLLLLLLLPIIIIITNTTTTTTTTNTTITTITTTSNKHHTSNSLFGSDRRGDSDHSASDLSAPTRVPMSKGARPFESLLLLLLPLLLLRIIFSTRITINITITCRKAMIAFMRRRPREHDVQDPVTILSNY